MNKIKIICIVGPTAGGKTSLGVEIAKRVNGEIISADSMQIYKNMPIATAVASKEEKQGIPHYLTEFLDIDQSYSVADFVQDANIVIDDIVSRNKLPIIVGGTGLFVDSLVKGIQFSQSNIDENLRKELEQLSNEELYEMLKKLDNESADKIHPNNRKRVIRAIEMCSNGKTKTEQDKLALQNESRYDALYIAIGYRDREKLYERINKRVDLMIANGLEDEARKIYSNAGSTSCQAIGHKELQGYINGDITLDEAVENLKRITRNYAKRQLTWFRRNEKINWLYADEMTNEELLSKALDLTERFLK